MITETDLERAATELREAGCVAAEEEAAKLVEAAGGARPRLRELLARRCAGEPLAWLIGSTSFCGETVLVHPGVYVPRMQSERIALRAVALLPARGLAVDLCTGSGAIAVVLKRRRPLARVAASEIDPRAAACARANGVEVFLGDLTAGLPSRLRGLADVVTAVVPYVPTAELRLLPRDVLAHEPRPALDGGADGTTLLRRAAHEARSLLRPGGPLLLELGGEEADVLRPLLLDLGYRDLDLIFDEEGDLRGLSSRR
jgi:release factor glutamine methyltransferase